MKGPIQANIKALGPFGFTMSCVITPLASATCRNPKITLMASGKAAENPMKDPKVMV